MSSTAAISTEVDEALVSELLGIEGPERVIGEVISRFGARAAIGTSGQLSGCVLIDLASRSGLPFRVFVVDTLRLHQETYELWERIEQHYGIELERFRPDPDRLDRMVRQHGEFLFFDTKAKQEYCCDIRKVEPNRRALSTLDAWITGVRKDQSKSREATPLVQIVRREGHRILRVCPLAQWTEEQVFDYIKLHGIPYNPLFDPLANGARYPSLGCIVCSTPILPHEDGRAGRWRWFNERSEESKECGIHQDYSI